MNRAVLVVEEVPAEEAEPPMWAKEGWAVPFRIRRREDQRGAAEARAVLPMAEVRAQERRLAERVLEERLPMPPWVAQRVASGARQIWAVAGAAVR